LLAAPVDAASKIPTNATRKIFQYLSEQRRKTVRYAQIEPSLLEDAEAILFAVAGI
jgi:hypothetical protein